MIKSMTGYGRGRCVMGGREIGVEIKSVNGRYLDIFIRAPKIYGFLDEKIRAMAIKYVSRGKMDIFVSVENLADKQLNLSLNKNYVKSYISVLRELRDEYNLTDDITTMRVAQNREIFSAEKTEDDEIQLWQEVSEVAAAAFEEHNAMRIAEGERLFGDMNARIDSCTALAEKIYIVSENNKTTCYSALKQKIKEIISDAGVSVDENRIVTEAAVLADKMSITEEIIRLRSHFSQFKKIVSGKLPAGRKIDFLLQEINREINTIGSKSQDFNIAAEVIDMKSEIEKVREQIQNVE